MEVSFNHPEPVSPEQVSEYQRSLAKLEGQSVELRQLLEVPVHGFTPVQAQVLQRLTEVRFNA